MSQRETADGCTLTRSGLALFSLGALFSLTFWGFPQPAASAELKSQPYQCSAEQNEFLEELQRRTFKYFWDNSGGSGLTPDRTPGADTCSVAAVGFALTSYLVGAERGYVSRDEAAHRTYAALRVLWQAPQGPAAAGVAGFKGFFYHFLDGHDGLRSADSELSTIDTALLMAGVLSSLVYFDRDDEVESSIRQLSDDLYRRVDWSWAYSRHHPPLLSMGWSPEHGFIDYDWRGYNEGMILYLLALGSPTHPIEPQAWDEWTHDYVWEERDGIPSVTFGPLFGHQYSHVWIDFRGIQDGIMRSKGSDYFMNSTRATYANRAYCIANPGKWKGYGELVWGLTASDGPLHATPGSGTEPTPFHSYWARGAGVSTAADDGTIAPTAVGRIRAVRSGSGDPHARQPAGSLR